MADSQVGEQKDELLVRIPDVYPDAGR